MELAAIGVVAWVGLGILAVAAAALLSPVVLRVWVTARYARGARDWRIRVVRRYRGAGTYAWMFAYCKTRMDPMFAELPRMLSGKPVYQILDVGCGYGCAGCAALEWLETARIYGVDPDSRRVWAAGMAFGERGRTAVGAAPNLELLEAERFDLVLMLDMIHFLDDEELATTLRRVHDKMNKGARLVLRAGVRAKGGGSAERDADRTRKASTERIVFVRTLEEIGNAVMGADFQAVRTEMSGGNAESWWVTASA